MDKPVQQGIAQSNIKEKVISVFIERMQNLVKDNHERMLNYNKDNAAQMLAKGFFYPNDYCMALTEMGQTARLDFLKNNGAFFHGFMSPKYFTHQNTTNPILVTGKIPMSFLLKDNVKPSEALASTRAGLSLIGCGEACDIVFYEAMLHLWGKEKFDLLLDKKGSMPFCIWHQPQSEDPLSLIFTRTMSHQTLEQTQKGQLIHIGNAKTYTIKHPQGEEQGINLICIDDTAGAQKFIGLGTPPEGISYDMACKWLFDAYNKKPIAIEQIVSEKYALKDHEYEIQGILQELQSADNKTLMDILSFIEQNLPAPFTSEQTTALLQNLSEIAKLLVSAKLAYKQQHMVLTWEKFLQEGGGSLKQISELNYERIEVLHNQSLPQANNTLSHWRVQANRVLLAQRR